tara:strand:- start:1651 stop:1815 length:165 start_codon:yes stop_codon:yes gene_type:complete
MNILIEILGSLLAGFFIAMLLRVENRKVLTILIGAVFYYFYTRFYPFGGLFPLF